jgi:hypothetical protein
MNSGWPGVNSWHCLSAWPFGAINLSRERQFSPKCELSLGC